MKAPHRTSASGSLLANRFTDCQTGITCPDQEAVLRKQLTPKQPYMKLCKRFQSEAKTGSIFRENGPVCSRDYSDEVSAGFPAADRIINRRVSNCGNPDVQLILNLYRESDLGVANCEMLIHDSVGDGVYPSAGT